MDNWFAAFSWLEMEWVHKTIRLAMLVASVAGLPGSALQVRTRRGTSSTPGMPSGLRPSCVSQHTAVYRCPKRRRVPQRGALNLQHFCQGASSELTPSALAC